MSNIYLPLVTNSCSSQTDSDATTNASVAWSAPIATSPTDGSVWVVNPDADSVSVLISQSLIKHGEVNVGSEPWSLAVDPTGSFVYVLNRADGTLSVVSVRTLTTIQTLNVGAEPNAIVLSPNGRLAYVTLMGENAVVTIDLACMKILRQIAVDALPYAIAITSGDDVNGGDAQLYVTHLQSFPLTNGKEATDEGREGRVTVIDASSFKIIKQIVLPANENGFPNRNVGFTIFENRAWLPHLRSAPALPRTLTTSVFAAVSSLDLTQLEEDRNAYLPLNDQIIFGSPVNNPSAAIPALDGKRLYVVLAGSDLVEVVDVSTPSLPALVRFLPVGHNPLGMAISTNGKEGYVMNYLSRSVTVLDLEALSVRAEISVTQETLAPEILKGKILFNNASNSKLSQGSWISCASCHFDGLPDGVTWIFPDGPRQTPMLWNAGKTLPWHWSAALDEAQDVEETIQLIQHGTGLAPGVDPAQLGAPNAGRSAHLDALVAFMNNGIRMITLPTPAASEAKGRDLFVNAGCAECHGGATWTSSKLPGAAGTLDPDGNGMIDDVLRDVGTYNDLDQRGATGFDPPSLLGVKLTAPYFHDGSAATLEDVIRSGHPMPTPSGTTLDESEIVALLAFLQSIDAETPAIDVR